MRQPLAMIRVGVYVDRRGGPQSATQAICAGYYPADQAASAFNAGSISKNLEIAVEQFFGCFLLDF
jgi:hypothetical protein